MTIRGPKKRTWGNIKLRENELVNPKEQAVVTANPCTALATNSNMPRNENRMKTVYENKPRAINCDLEKKWSMLYKLFKYWRTTRRTKYENQSGT